MIPVITIQGPTGSGKSDLAVKLCKALDTELISADSRQVYRYMDIGTAKPDKQIQNEIKHHLIDIIDPSERYNTGSFLRDSSLIINELYERGKIPVICGGSMLYVKNLIEGISEIPDVPEDIKKYVAELFHQKSIIELYDMVKVFDPVFANGISTSDKQRISRALEVWYAFKRPLTDFWLNEKLIKNSYLPFQIYINQDRDILYQRINNRMDMMLKAGLLDEISNLFSLGYDENSPGLNSVGYIEFMPCFKEKKLQNNAMIKDCKELAAQHTRNYAKRQITWYKKIKFQLAISPESINISYILEKINHYFNI